MLPIDGVLVYWLIEEGCIAYMIRFYVSGLFCVEDSWVSKVESVLIDLLLYHLQVSYEAGLKIDYYENQKGGYP